MSLAETIAYHRSDDDDDDADDEQCGSGDVAARKSRKGQMRGKREERRSGSERCS
jgi:hypothetical protein